MNKAQVLGLLRHVLTFGGGYLVSKQLIPDVVLQEAIGAVITLVGIVWSVMTPEKKD